MSSIKVAVSLPEALFERLQTSATEAHVPRSKLVAEPLSEYLARREIERLRERINTAYADGLGADERSSLNVVRRMQREIVDPHEW